MAQAVLHCTSNTSPLRRAEASRALTDDERDALGTLASASDLCGGGHTAKPPALQHSDGLWDESLKAQCADGQLVLLLVTDNPTFDGETATAKLLQRLRTLHRDLQKELKFQK